MSTESISRGAFRVTAHAITRAVQRLGVAPEQAANHLNQLMQSAIFVGNDSRDGNMYRKYVHQRSDTKIIIKGNTIVTVYPQTIAESINATFLRPILEREKRKIRREHVRIVRALEYEEASAMQEYAEMALNRARARNPKTRELIAQRMADTQASINDIKAKIELQESEYETKIKAIEIIAN